MTQKSTLEEHLIKHCAPTLAGIKSASLFSYFFEKERVVLDELDSVNKMLNERGVLIEPLLWRENRVLVYVYRPLMLQRDLSSSVFGRKKSETNDGLHRIVH